MAAVHQALSLDLSAYGLSSQPLLPLNGIHPALLNFVELHKHYQSLEADTYSSGSKLEHNNNELPSLLVSSSRSDSESTASPPTQRENVIVRHDSKRKKEMVKDHAYWERRKKNNDAAKRSRDTRRMKEDEMASRAAVLEQDNMRLRGELEQLRLETDQLRTLLLAPSNIIKAPVARHAVPTFGPSLIAAPSVITPNDTYSTPLRLQFPDSTQRNSVLVNYTSST